MYSQTTEGRGGGGGEAGKTKSSYSQLVDDLSCIKKKNHSTSLDKRTWKSSDNMRRCSSMIPCEININALERFLDAEAVRVCKAEALLITFASYIIYWKARMKM
jgi:hypothetical protein